MPLNCLHGFSVSSFFSCTTPRTHFFPELRLARSKAARRAPDHFLIVLGLRAEASFLLLGNWRRQFFAKASAFLSNLAQSSGVARVIGSNPVTSLNAWMA